MKKNVCVYRGCEKLAKEHWVPMGDETHIYRLCEACLEKVRGNYVISTSNRIGNLKYITECYIDGEPEPETVGLQGEVGNNVF